MRTTTTVFALAAAAALVAANAHAEKDKAGFERIAPEDVKWSDRPGYDGVKFATLFGDPSKPGLYVIRAKFSPGAMTRPHWHADERYVTVLQGTWYSGEGDTFEPDKTVPLKPGSLMIHPAKGHHYDGAKNEEVIVQIIGIGPSSTVPIDPKQGNTGRSIKP
jgi:hypothetical protein